MPRTAAPPAPPPIAVRAVRPWWVSAWTYGTRTVRELRGTLDPSGPALRMTAGPDGVPVYVPVIPRELPSTRAARWTRRHRRTLAPLPVAAGYAALNAAHFTGPDAPRWVAVAALVAPLLAVAAWLGILGGDDRTPGTLRLLAATITALEGWWLAPDRWVPGGAVWAVAGLAAAGSARRFRRRPDPPDPGPDPDVPWQVTRWEEKIGADGGVLPGAVAHFAGDLHPPDAAPDTPPIGFKLAVELVEGKQEVATLRGRLGLIAGVYHLSKAGAVIDEWDDETRAVLTFTTRKFLAKTQPWTRPTLHVDGPDAGRFTWMRLADGTPGYGTHWIPRQGTRPVWMVGAQGGGKSGAVDTFLVNVMQGGLTVLDATDLKGGASVPHWRYRAVRWGTTLTDGIAALRRGVWLCDLRYDVMARLPAVDADGNPETVDGHPAVGRTWVDPSPDWPVYVVLVEEWAQLVADPVLGELAIWLAARISALGRQALVKPAYTTQPANLDLAFGSNRGLRTNVQSGDVLVLWTDQTSGNLAVAERAIDVSRIPKGMGGVGYLAGPAQRRDLQGRVEHVEDAWAAVRATTAGTLPPPEAAIIDAADVYSATGSMADARAAALAAFPGDVEWAQRIDRILPPDVDPDGTPTPDLAGVAWDPGLVIGQPGAPPARPEGQRTILAALAARGRSAADLRAALGDVTDQALRRHLNPLMDAELVARAAHGVYVLTTPANPTPE